MIKLPLQTERFVVRRFQENDLDRFLDFMLDEYSTKFLMFDEAQKTESGAKALFSHVIASYEADEPIHSYAVADKNTNRYLGSCGFSFYSEGIYECYYSINRTETGRGVATEAISAVAKALSEKVEVRAYCHPENKAAHAVAKKAGFCSEGVQVHEQFGVAGHLFVFGK